MDVCNKVFRFDIRIFHSLFYVDSDKVTAKVKNVFGHGEPQLDVGNPSHENLIEKVSRLCRELHSDPAKVLSKHSKGGRKLKRESIQKNLVIKHPGHNPCDVRPLHE